MGVVKKYLVTFLVQECHLVFFPAINDSWINEELDGNV